MPIYNIPSSSGGASNSGEIIAARLAGSTFSTVQHIQDVFHSSGITSTNPAYITDAGGGLITIGAGSGLIRATNSPTAELLFCDWPDSIPADVVLVDNVLNYVYVTYNAGNPKLVTSTVKPTDYHTNIYYGTVYRVGTVLHITKVAGHHIADHAGLMILRAKELAPFARYSGCMISGTGTLKIAVTAGTFWHGLERYTTPAFDSNVAGTFTSYYRNGVGGWTSIPAQTTINSTQYDDGTGTLATLGNQRYGVHWVYQETDGEVNVVIGKGSYSLIEAQAATMPSTVPPQFQDHARIIGKIIVQKSATVFTSVSSAFTNAFSNGAATDHNDLINKGTLTHTQLETSLNLKAPLLSPVFTGNVRRSVTGSITAFAGGGQASATVLASDINVVSVCATAADSVILVAGLTGMEIKVVNRGDAAMNLFPAVGGSINELAVNTAVSIAVNATAICLCHAAGQWEVVEVSRA